MSQILDVILRRLDQIEADHHQLKTTVEGKEEDIRLTTPAVARHYAVSTRTIKRWGDDPTIGFPQPEYTASGRSYTWLSQLRAYDRAQAQTRRNAPRVAAPKFGRV
jgi:hypothetical protein